MAYVLLAILYMFFLLLLDWAEQPKMLLVEVRMEQQLLPVHLELRHTRMCGVILVLKPTVQLPHLR